MMTTSFVDPRKIFSTALLLAVLLHLLMMALFSFTLSVKSSGHKPLMTFLGPILSEHDFFMGSRVMRVEEKRTSSNIISTKNFIKNQPHQQSLTPSRKPVFFEKFISKDKTQFKPPKEMFISQEVLEDEPPQGGKSMNIPQGLPQWEPLRQPLKFDGP